MQLSVVMVLLFVLDEARVRVLLLLLLLFRSPYQPE